MKVINHNGIKVNVEIKNNKNMYLKIDENLEPLLIISHKVSGKDIFCFLEESLPKIQKHIDRKKINKKWDFVNENFIFLCGIKYQIVVDQIEANKRTKIQKQDSNILFVNLPKGKNLETEIWKFVKKEASKMWNPLMEKSAKEMGVEYLLLKVNSSITKWGSCNYVSKSINLSKRLYCEPVPSQLYVIIHELAHLIVPNHSKEFWNEVERYMPEYKKYSNILKY